MCWPCSDLVIPPLLAGEGAVCYPGWGVTQNLLTSAPAAERGISSLAPDTTTPQAAVGRMSVDQLRSTLDSSRRSPPNLCRPRRSNINNPGGLISPALLFYPGTLRPAAA